MFTRSSGYKLSLFICIHLFSGCAINYTDKYGYQRSIGFMNIKSRKEDCVLTTQIKTLGINLDVTESSGGFNIGYRNISKLMIEDDESIVIELSADHSEFKVVAYQGDKKEACLLK